MLPLAQTYASWLAVLRIVTGIFWLLHGVPKILNPQFATQHGMMANMLQQAVPGSSGAYASFLTHVVLPNASLFAHLVAWGETLTGVSLVLGLFSRVGGFFGVFLPLNYWLMKNGWAHMGDWSGLDLAMVALSAINLVLPTGLVFGLDGYLAHRKRPSRG